MRKLLRKETTSADCQTGKQYWNYTVCWRRLAWSVQWKWKIFS